MTPRSVCYALAAEFALAGPNGGDFDGDGDGDVDMLDYQAFANCFSGADGGPVIPECEPGDFDHDGDVDCDDWDAFVLAWTGPTPTPQLPQCAGSIPTVSQWGLVVMTLLVLTAGTIVFSRETYLRRSSTLG